MSGLPVESEELLLDVIADGFNLYCCGPKHAPHALVAAYDWPGCIDLVSIRDFDHVGCARVLRPADIFAPEVVAWACQGQAQPAVRALLALPHPDHPLAPAQERPAPRVLAVPRAQQRPMSIRLPSAGRAGARGRRLAAGLVPS